MMTTVTDNDYIIDDIILTEPAYQAIGGVGLQNDVHMCRVSYTHGHVFMKV